MGVEYEAEVFFGAYCPRKSPLGKRLKAYVEKAGGTPAATETAGVEISEVGSWPTSETWMVVRAVGSAMSFGREDDVDAPRALSEDPRWRIALEAFFGRCGFTSPTMPAIGWHFAASVS